MQDRTEAPTPRRLEEARNRGQVARSTELASAFGLLGLTLLAPPYVAALVRGIVAMIQDYLRTPAPAEFTLAIAVQYGVQAELAILRLLWPVLAATALLGVMASLWQIGFLLTLHPLAPDFSRINPLAGLQRLFSTRTLVEAVHGLLKVAVVGGGAYLVVWDQTVGLLPLIGGNLWGSGATLLDAARELALKLSLAMGVLAGAHYIYQRWEQLRQLRMTRQEVRDEMRQMEGDPVIRSELRRRQRQITSGRMMAAVPKATVVITNPTHYAVALLYEPEKMAAPRVVAKGQMLLAERIKSIAKGAGVPIVENVPLAQALFRSVDIDREIPSGLYQAVAEVLGFIYRLKGRRYGD